MITNEALRVLENNLTFTKGVNRDYDDKFGIDGARIGTTLNVRKPARYVGRTGAALSLEDQTESQVAIALNTQFGVDVSFTSSERSLSLDTFSDRVLSPAMAIIANKIDRDGLALYAKVARTVVGTGSSTTLSYNDVVDAGALMSEESTPADQNRSFVMGPRAQGQLVKDGKALFNATTELEAQYKTGNMGMVSGFKASMDQNVPSFTTGLRGGTPLIATTSTSGDTTIATKGWSNSITGLLTVGDTFTVAGVYAVNPQSRQSTGTLRQFVVTAIANSDGSGNATVSVYPAIISSGQFQTVSALPTLNAAITMVGANATAHQVSLGYHRDAFCLATADLMLPKGVHEAARAASKQTGISIRMITQYLIATDTFATRFDVLYGWKELYPELACKVLSV
jgi:hypothetical protein